MKILLSGLYGHMGREVYQLTRETYKDCEITAGIDLNSDGSIPVPCFTSFREVTGDFACIVDFSHHSLTEALTAFAVAKKCPLVIATTGQTPEEHALIKDAALQIPVFFAANYSLGIAVLSKIAQTVVRAMPEAEIEIIEAHHDRKLDAPSGTALALASAIQKIRPECETRLGRSGAGKRTKNEIGIHAVRMGNIVGIHEIIIGTPNQTITLKHEAHDRALFAEGALAAARFITNQPAGFYTMQELLAE